MHSFDVIISLPASLSCTVLRDWLTLKFVVALDTAYCCKSKRKHFENLLRSNEYLIHEKVTFLMNTTEQCDIWSGIPKFGRNLRSVAVKNEFSEAQGHLIAQYCTNLTSVHLHSKYCSFSMWSILGVNKNIERLILHFNLNNPLLSLPVGGISMPKLRSLALIGDAFEYEHIVDALKMSNNIVKLNLYVPKISQSAILQISCQCPHLTALGLVYAPLNDDIIAQLTASCSQIIHLDIQNVSGSGQNVGITDAGILAIVQNLTGLQSLNIKNNHNLSDASLVHLYTHCANTLHTLYFTCGVEEGEGQVYGPEAVHDLLERCTKLRILYFGFYHEIDGYETGIILPATTLCNLTELVLCGDIANDGNLAAISQLGAKLQVLGVVGEREVYTHTHWARLLEGCPNLTEVYVTRAAKQMLSTWAEEKLGRMVRVGIPTHLQRLDVLNM